MTLDKDKKSSPLNVSFTTKERKFLKDWAKVEGHSMAVIIKKALYEYYLRHEIEHQEKIRKKNF